VLYIAGALLLFLLALDLMVASLQQLGGTVAQVILLATANPFAGLFIGLLLTAMLQSSSTTTALVVAFVASGALSLGSAVPIIMGANVGTTITAMIVSIGFISRKKEFKRAVAAGSSHFFFNLLTAAVIFPLEYHYHLLSRFSAAVAGSVTHTQQAPALPVSWDGFDTLADLLTSVAPLPFLWAAVALILLFSSILIFRKLVADLLKARSPEAFSRFFFKNAYKSFGWGLLTTAAIRSSTITTSIVVPIVAKKIATLRQAAPFILGANVGTTITAFIAALVHGYTVEVVSIAVAHFLFNLAGVLIFLPVPVLRKSLLWLSAGFGKMTAEHRLAGFLFLLFTFFLVPFFLIFLNQRH